MSEVRERQPEPTGGGSFAMDRGAEGLGGPTGGEKRPNPWLVFFRRLFREKPLGTIGLVLVVLLVLVAVLADVISPYGMDEKDLAHRLEGPTAEHWLGTDRLGQDELTRIIYGGRISLYVGLGAALLSTIVSVAIGVPSAYIGGKYDIILQRFVDAINAFPMLIILILVVSLIGPGIWQMITVLGVAGGIAASRAARAAAFYVKENTYMETSRAIGCTTRRVILRHLLPNIAPLLIIGFSISIGGFILTEAGLSFLGFGLPPKYPSWGRMISDSRTLTYQAPWMAIWPGVAITLAVFGLNIFGDAVRDLVDPRLRGGVGGIGSYGHERAEKALRKLEKIRRKARNRAT